MRTAAGLALLAGASIGLAWAGRTHLMTSARFAIASFEVTGCERRSAAALEAESGLALGTNIFAADLEAARKRLLSDPWIVDALLARRLPGTVVIRVTERRPAALVVLDDTYLATAAGAPFKKLEPDDPVDFPVVTGVTADAIARDPTGAERTIAQAIDLATEFARSPLGVKSPLEEVHASGDGAFTLVVGHAGVHIVLGGAPFRRKIEQAARVAAEVERRGGKPDAILLDNDTRPERVVVRMR